MTLDATPKIVDALLTLISRLGLWPCRILFCSQSLPICWLCVNTVAQPLNRTRCNTQVYWHSVDDLLMLCWCSVDARLMVCWRSVAAHCQVKWRRHERICLYRWPILWSWIDAVAQPLNVTWCNTQNRWRYVDAHFQIGAVNMSPSLLHTMSANTLIMGECRSTACESYKMQHPRLLTLCWYSVDALFTPCWRSVYAHCEVKGRPN
jgi:hypothetical protein